MTVQNINRIQTEAEKIVAKEGVVTLSDLMSEFKEQRDSHMVMNHSDYPVRRLDLLKAVASSKIIYLDEGELVRFNKLVHMPDENNRLEEVSRYILMMVVGYFVRVGVELAGFGL